MSNDQNEAKRARVRRLLIEPLQAAGLCYPKKVSDEVQRKRLAALADDLTYMSDAGLKALQQSMLTKGEGSAKKFWPERITFIGWAEAYEKRPLGQVPAVLGWFKSRAGRDALREGRLVAEYEFWRDRKRPPVSDRERTSIRDRADEINSQVARHEDRMERQVPAFFDDGDFYRWYQGVLKQCKAWVAEGEAARQGEAAV